MKTEARRSDRNEAISAALACERRGSYRAAISLLWIAVREQLFQTLDRSGVRYDSTEEAIYGFLKTCQSRRVSQHVVELYHIAILIEFSEYDFAGDPVAQKYLATAKSTLTFFMGDLQEDKPFRDVMLGELDEHINDCRWSLTSHFVASERFASLHKYVISYPLVAGSALLAVVSVDSLNQLFVSATGGTEIQEGLTELIAVVVLTMSILSASIDWKDRAAKHNAAANKYIGLRRDARQLKLQIEATADPVVLQSVMTEKLNTIKTSLNHVAEEAPQIPEWAFAVSRRKIGVDNLHLPASNAASEGG